MSEPSESQNPKNQIDLNQAAYEKIKETLEAEHHGRHALMHDGEVISILDNSEIAYAVGCDRFGLGYFSIVEIGQKPISLGALTLLLGNQQVTQ